VPISTNARSSAAKTEDRSSVLTAWTSAPGSGIAGDAAAEIGHLAGDRVLGPLAQEVDIGDHACLVGRDLHRADVGDQPVGADQHLNLAADLAGHRDRRILVLASCARRGPFMHICEPDPAISITLPIDSRWAGKGGPSGSASPSSE
jgi:hypothetical protein